MKGYQYRRCDLLPVGWIGLILVAGLLPGRAQIVKPLSVLSGQEEQLLEMRWSDAPLDVVLDHYAELTGRTLIKSPGVPAVLVTLRSQEKLNETEFLQAIESILAMNQIALIPLEDKFLRVVPIAEVGTYGDDIVFSGDVSDEPATDELESRVIELKYLEMAEVQPLIDTLKHTYGKVQPLERANGFLIRDTKVNLQRIVELIAFIDKPVEIKVETRIYELRHAIASEVASKLNELIQESQGGQQQPQRTAQRTPARTTATTGTRGVVRPGTAQRTPAQAAAQTPPQVQAELAERGIIQGDVKIVSDERTNLIIVISEPQNFTFFDRIVTILDKSVDPEIALEVLGLEYADAEEISSILNDFIGAATQERSSARVRAADAAQSAGTDARATALRDFIARRQAAAASTRAGAQTAQELSAGLAQLSENTRILADQRTNSLLLMGRRVDIESLKQVVDQLDIMLAQVMIEAVLLEIQLDDDLEVGIDWLQRGYQVFNEESRGPGGRVTVREPVLGFGGASTPRGTEDFIDGGTVSRGTAFSPGALTYYATFYDLNVDAIIRLAASSSNAKILSTPVIVTTDNTEASIIVGESRPVVTSTSTTVGGVGRNTFQYQDIALVLTVTPRINPQKFVVMEINQTADGVGGFEVIDGNNVPVITRREMEAQIAVENRSSIVLGGLVGSEVRKARTKIPLVGDIPIVGALFRSDSTQDNRTELIVIITPYVMSTPEEVRAEARRLYERSLSYAGWDETWSDSPLLQRNRVTDEDAPKPLLERFVDQFLEEDAPSPKGIFGEENARRTASRELSDRAFTAAELETLFPIEDDAPVAEPAVEPVAEPVVEPVAEPVVEPVAEPVVEPVVEPTPPPVVEPMEDDTEPAPPLSRQVEPAAIPVVEAEVASVPAATDAPADVAQAIRDLNLVAPVEAPDDSPAAALDQPVPASALMETPAVPPDSSEPRRGLMERLLKQPVDESDDTPEPSVEPAAAIPDTITVAAARRPVDDEGGSGEWKSVTGVSAPAQAKPMVKRPDESSVAGEPVDEPAEVLPVQVSSPAAPVEGDRQTGSLLLAPPKPAPAATPVRQPVRRPLAVRRTALPSAVAGGEPAGSEPAAETVTSEDGDQEKSPAAPAAAPGGAVNEVDDTAAPAPLK